MIDPISQNEAQKLRKKLSAPAVRLEIFPDVEEYLSWIAKIFDFVVSKDSNLDFGIEQYRGDLEFFKIESAQSFPLLFVSKFLPIELIFFGTDWKIGISSYPEVEGANNLEYALRLYGTASILANSMLK